MHFSDRLAAVIKQKNSCLMLGLDPNWDKLPSHLKTGKSLQQKADIYEQFCCDMVDTCASEVCGIKIQMGYFEALGSVGVKAVENLIAYARQNHPELIIMKDAKRGDIGSTSTAYAQSSLWNDRPLSADCVTLNPYMGTDVIQAYLDVLEVRENKAIFVLVKTSNPSAKEFQDAIYEKVAQKVETWGEDTKKITEKVNIPDDWGFVDLGKHKWSRVGAVVGATNGEEISHARSLMPSTWILAPGVGAQGGKIEDVLAIRDADGLGILIPVSRSVLYASDGEDYLQAAQAEIKQLWEAQKM